MATTMHGQRLLPPGQQAVHLGRGRPADVRPGRQRPAWVQCRLHLGIGLTADCIHAPNEGVDVDQLGRGVLAAGELWREPAALPC